MPQSCRNNQLTLWQNNRIHRAANASLILAKYLKEHDQNNANKRELLVIAQEAVGNLGEFYQIAFSNRDSFLKQKTTCQTVVLSIQGRLVLGLGMNSVLETGLTLHHTYGSPMIPGSSIKGTLAHYCHEIWGSNDDSFCLGGSNHRIIFGTTEESGHLIFHDAWIHPNSVQRSLQIDVMTPHHADYYTGTAYPTDFDDPNPISFLSVVGNFQFHLTCNVENDEGKKWSSLALCLLEEAANEWGLGGKTNSGYGRMTSVPVVGPSQGVSKHRYKIGDNVTVERIEDPKGKGRMFFRADDGKIGNLLPGVAISVEIGQKIELKVKHLQENSYAFEAK